MHMAAVSKEDKQKKNTDCVYFLASPRTCKKGAECEFRHSETARTNHRDCWFWLSGSCHNANCSFRHPPLEGMSELPAATIAVAAKSRIPCYFYAQGYCARGDKCGFQHGVSQITTETVKLSKPKLSEANDKLVSISKGNESVTSKPLGNKFAYMQVDTEVEPCFVGCGDAGIGRFTASNVLGRMQQESGSSAPSRSHTIHDVSEITKSRHGSAVDIVAKQSGGDNPMLLSPGGDGNHVADVSFHDGQAEDEIVRKENPADKGIENGMDSDEIKEESSFDVLVDDGSDQVIYEDGFDYLPCCDLVVDPMSSHVRRRIIGTEDLGDLNYDPSAYEQYFDGAVDYEIPAYESFQQAGYDPLAAFNYVEEHEWNEREVFFNDKREPVPEEHQRGISSDDLRNHLLRRRRADRGRKNGAGHYRGRHRDSMINGCQDRHSHDVNFSHQQDRRRRMQQGAPRSNKQNQQESTRNKRTYRDMGLEYERNSSERNLFKRMSQLGQRGSVRTHNEQKQTILGDGEFSCICSHSVSNNKKARMIKDDAVFTGPKSLAQIKAEKMKIYDDESSALGVGVNHTYYQRVSPLKSSSTAFSNSSALTHKDCGSSFSIKRWDFKGPKPLSEILKEKHKGEIRCGRFQEPQSYLKATQKRENSCNGVSSLLIKDERAVNDSVQEPLRTEADLQQGDVHVSPQQKQSVNGFGHGTDAFHMEGMDNVWDEVELDDEENDDFAKRLKGIFS